MAVLGDLNLAVWYGIAIYVHVRIIRGEPERAPNTRDTGSGFICICMFAG